MRKYIFVVIVIIIFASIYLISSSNEKNIDTTENIIEQIHGFKNCIIEIKRETAIVYIKSDRGFNNEQYDEIKQFILSRGIIGVKYTKIIVK